MSVLEGKSEAYHERREELLDAAPELARERSEQHNALLEAVSDEEELVVDEHETVEIGSATLTVRTEMPGSVMRKVDTVYDTEQPPGQMLDTYVDILTSQTMEVQAGDVSVDSESDIRLFWRDFLDTNDFEKAGTLAMNRVIEEPLELEQKRRQEAVRSFRGNR